MILKRWALNLISLMCGMWTGWWVVQYLDQKLAIPPVAAIVIMGFCSGVFLVISYAFGQTIFPPTQAEVIRPEIPRQPWAWLRPKKEGVRAGYPINRDQVVLGRDTKTDILLNDDSVSRRHAEIVRLAEGYLLRDLNSKNGTFVNGQRIQEYLLSEGDTVAIGDVQLRFEAPRRPEVVTLEEPEHLSVSQLLSPEVLPLEDEESDFGGGTAVLRAPDLSEGGTEVHRAPEGPKKKK